MLRAELLAAVGAGRTVDHFVGHLATGDAVSSDAVAKWRAFRDIGVPGELYTADPGEHHRSIAQPLARHNPARSALLVFHYSVWSETAAYVASLVDTPVLFVYHNVTPTGWFEGVNPQAERDTRDGRARLGEFASRSPFAVADSAYSRQELDERGFPATGVVPLLVDLRWLSSRPPRSRSSRDSTTTFLSVGRIAPNKCHEDTIKIFCHYHRAIDARSRLRIVGQTVVGPYRDWLDRQVRRLGLTDAVTFTGKISDEALATEYAGADAYICMSEHEGFCAPILEAMHAGIPVLAFAATAVPDTMGNGGVLLLRKDPAVGAEALHLLVTNPALRQRIVEKGRQRVEEFSPALVRRQIFAAALKALELDRARRASAAHPR